jgi:hypothetical protein
MKQIRSKEDSEDISSIKAEAQRKTLFVAAVKRNRDALWKLN